MTEKGKNGINTDYVRYRLNDDDLYNDTARAVTKFAKYDRACIVALRGIITSAELRANGGRFDTSTIEALDRVDWRVVLSYAKDW